MKLKIINPDYGLSEEEIKSRVVILQKVARPDTIISMECPTNNNIYIDSQLDVAIDSNEIIQMALRAERQGYDAIGIYCFSDPAIEACREMLTIPVLGGGQTSILTAALLGNSFSIITTGKQRISQKKEFVRTTGVDYTRLCSVRSIEYSMVEAEREDVDRKVDALTKVGEKCVEDGADVVILGCLSFVGIADKISERIGVPVVDPAFTLIPMAELMVTSHITHSKKSYPFPPKRERSWSGGTIKI